MEDYPPPDSGSEKEQDEGPRKSAQLPVGRAATMRGSTIGRNDGVNVEQFQAVEKVLRQLEADYNHQIEVQEQKDNAQDELLAMQFDNFRRDLEGYANFAALEEQKAFLISKIANNDMEMKEGMRTFGAQMREEVGKDARKLQDQLEKVSTAVVAQIKMVDTRLKENCAADDVFEKLVGDRLAAVEQELGLDSKGGGGDDGGGGNAPSSRGRGMPKGAQKEMEARFDQISSLLEELNTRMQAQEEHVAQQLGPTSPAAALDAEGKPVTIKDRIETLEDNAEIQAEKEEERGKELEELKQKVGRAANPLDWLEERVGELAKSRGGERVDVIKGLAEVTERLEAMELWKEKAVADMEAVVAKTLAEQGAAEAEEDDEGSSLGGGAPSSQSARNSSSKGRKGASREEESVTANGTRLTYVNLFEDMERLRSIIECMEGQMPIEVRKHMAFFKGSRSDLGSREGERKANAGGKKPSSGMELEVEVFGLRAETDEQAQRLQRCEELIAREYANVLKVVRGVEREQDGMKTKVDELWHKFPDLMQVLMPLQVHVQALSTDCEPGSPGGGVTRVEASLEGLRPLSGLMEAELNKSLSKLQQDVANRLSEVRTEVGLKANSHDLTVLMDRVERVARTPTSPSRPTLASYKGKALERQAKLGLSGSCGDLKDSSKGFDRTRTPGGHDRCKTPQYAMSQSAGRLPVLSKTR